MKILMLCTKFSLNENDPWLTNELADSLQESGNEVTVVCLDWFGKLDAKNQRFTTSNGVEVESLVPVKIRSPFQLVSRLVKWTLSSFSAYWSVRRLMKQKHFDLIIGFSPSATMALPILKMTGHGNVRSVLFQWDFFPHHHRQAGLIPSNSIFLLATKLEELLIRRFDIVACMSPANENYLRAHYPLRTSQRVCTLPVWGKAFALPEIDRTRIRAVYGLPASRPIVVFGGQLIQGRGVEDLLEMAKSAHEKNSQITFLIVGGGPLETLVKEYIDQGYDNLVWIAWVPRQEYLGIIQSCEVALVCTLRDVDVPSFPSKTIDYLRAGLPIVASVEKTTDYGDCLVSMGVGIGVEAGSPATLLSAIEALLENESKMRSMKERGPVTFDEYFEVKHVASRLIKIINQS